MMYCMSLRRMQTPRNKGIKNTANGGRRRDQNTYACALSAISPWQLVMGMFQAHATIILYTTRRYLLLLVLRFCYAEGMKSPKLTIEQRNA